MKLRMLMGAAVMTAVVAGGAAAVSLQERGKPVDAKMAKMIEYATPGAAHKALEPQVGKWNLKVKFFAAPGAPAEESEATSEVEWIMGNRYTHEEVNGSFMEQPFQGMGISGYDNVQKKYVSTWIDTMGTGIMTSQGTYDAASKTFTYNGECTDPMTGKMGKHRSTQKWTDNDHWVMQMFGPGEDGKEFMAMEIAGARAK